MSCSPPIVSKESRSSSRWSGSTRRWSSPSSSTSPDLREAERGNGARSRNARLAAINAFFRFLAYRLPDCLDQAGRIHAIPMKKTDEALVTHLTRLEMKALLDAPDPRTSSGTRDRAMLHLAFAAGLRVSELIGLQLDQVDQRNWASIHVMGKGRYQARAAALEGDSGRARGLDRHPPEAPPLSGKLARAISSSAASAAR